MDTLMVCALLLSHWHLSSPANEHATNDCWLRVESYAVYALQLLSLKLDCCPDLQAVPRNGFMSMFGEIQLTFMSQ